MRLSTEADRDPELAEQTIAAALEAGITVFDTARAYGRDEHELGRGERLLARALRGAGAGAAARVLTKGGMSRAGGAWIPDGRAKTIRTDCEASLVALDGIPIDTYLLHAPDPGVPWRTSLRALNRLLDDRLVKRIGVSNVNLRQLDEALALSPIAAVQVALSVHDDRAVRGGLLERCTERGIALIAHSPLGGPRRARSLAHDRPLAELALAWLLELSMNVVAIPGARRPETARSAARAGRLHLGPDELARLERSFRVSRTARTRQAPPPPRADDSEVVLIMGIPGAGKSRLAEAYRPRGYLRLNRDESGGALRELAEVLEHELASGAQRVVLDNTYLTRAARSYVVDVAARHGIPVRCVWLDTPLAQAQVNLVERLLERFGALPTPEELRVLARREPGALAPTQQMRAMRELEPPSSEEGFASVEVIPFARTSSPERTRGGTFVAAAALRGGGWRGALERTEPDAPLLVFDWRPGGASEELAPLIDRLRETTASSAPVEVALCPHDAGPPRCWCRPPLPGLPLAFARAHGVDPARSTLVGVSPAHRTLAGALGARYVDAQAHPTR
jgi:aryl-alcohol dehydrogenase-like predicted oxidoreductase/predicted kinase